MMMLSHSVCPWQAALPTIFASNFWKDRSLATERETTSALESAPFSFTT